MRIFVTGAAGLIGGEVARRLVEAGHRVTALVHRNPDIRGNDGRPPDLHEILKGDIAEARLGWSAEAFGAAARDHDLIIHCAATTRFDLGEADYRAVNIVGTAEIVALARAGGMALIHVSTAYVCGSRGGSISENDALPAKGFANGYEASKAASEALVAASGLAHAIVRPSIVVGDYENGAIRTFDAIYGAFKLIAEGRVRHMPATADATLDFVPIDHVAAGIVAIAERIEQASGGRFHLVSGQPIPVAQFAAAIGSFPQFKAPALVPPERFDPAMLQPRERRLYERVAGLYSSYFQRSPRFDDAEFRALTRLECPITGPAYLIRLIDYCIAAGFLSRAPSPAAVRAEP